MLLLGVPFTAGIFPWVHVTALRVPGEPDVRNYGALVPSVEDVPIHVAGTKGAP